MSYKHNTSFLQKIGLILFASMLLFIFELSLIITGYGDRSDREDPFVGFQKSYRIFGKKTLPNGEMVYATNKNKIKYFNYQEFPVKKGTDTYRIFCFGGSSTYGHPYNAKTAFSRWLQETLAFIDTDKKYEVINAGGISYASYRIVNVIEEAIRYDPDLFVIYSGHNEFLEERSYQKIKERSPILTKIQLMLNEVRLYILLKDIIYAINGWISSSSDNIKNGNRTILPEEVDHILDRSDGFEQYQVDNEQKAVTVAHYRYNLERMMEMAASANVNVILLNLPSNIRDFSPIKSDFLSGLERDRLMLWNKHYNKGKELLKKKRYYEAEVEFDNALRIDGSYADIYFQLAGIYENTERLTEAKQMYIEAKERDVCPLRVLEPINRTIEAVAEKYNFPFIDIVSAFEKNSENGIPGDDLFLDYVHPNIRGHRIIAKEIVDVMLKEGIVVSMSGWNQQDMEKRFAKIVNNLDKNYYAYGDANIGALLNWARKVKEAKGMLERSVKRYPDSKYVHFTLGDSYRRLGEFEKAVKEYNEVIRIELRLPYRDKNRMDYIAASHNRLGLVYQIMGKYDLAAEHAKKAIDMDFPAITSHHVLADIYFEKGLYDKALEEQKIILEEEPESAEIYNDIGLIYFAKGMYKEALTKYEEALKINSGLAKTYFNIGKIYEYEMSYLKAIENYQKSLKLDPENIGVLERFVSLYREQGRLGEVLKKFEDLLKIYPGSALIHYQTGLVAMEIGMHDTALENFLLSLKFQSESLSGKGTNNSYELLGRKHRHGSKFMKAAIHDRIGNIYYQKKMIDLAILEYKKAIELNPDLDGVYFDLAISYKDSGDMEKAVESLKQEITINPNDPQIHYYLGFFYGEEGRFKDALKEFETVLSIDPNFALAHKDMGVIYLYKIIDKKKALFHLKETLRIYPDQVQADEIRKAIEQLAMNDYENY